MKFLIWTTILTLDTRFATSLAITRGCLIKWRSSVWATTSTLTLVPSAIPSHKSRNTMCLPFISSHNSRDTIPSHNSRNAPAKSILKVFIQSLWRYLNLFLGLQPSDPNIHFLHCPPPDFTPFDDILKLIFAATSDNSPLRLQATTCSPHARIFQLQTTIYNTEWSSPIRTARIYHETTSFTGYNREEQFSKPYALATTSTLTSEFQYHQALT